ncbi:hypothetical protein SBRY_30915 [Actinacidiphila bryophytorum]|uniref:Uncharacterized protein n=1 Tax=Actinacidiphila bryophytorum TaxID=1436133 RepID=A0A9W4H220_9ACTN|nr:hypothetical protein SBRY_30915 [Actinacidiphila bryophytorum]
MPVLLTGRRTGEDAPESALTSPQPGTAARPVAVPPPTGEGVRPHVDHRQASAAAGPLAGQAVRDRAAGRGRCGGRHTGRFRPGDGLRGCGCRKRFRKRGPVGPGRAGRRRTARRGARRAHRVHHHLERRLQRRRQHRAEHRHLALRRRRRLDLRDRRDRDHDQQHGQRLPGRQRPPGAQGPAHRQRPGRELDVGPGRDAGGRLRRPAGRRRPDAGVDPAARRDHRQRRRLLAGLLDARLTAAGRGSVARVRRGRHPGGHQRPQLRVRHPALRCRLRRPLQRDQRRRQRRKGLLRLPDRLSHLRRRGGPLDLARADPLVPGRRELLHSQLQSGGRGGLGQRGRPQLLHHLRPGDRRRLPRGLRRRPQRRHRLRRADEHRLRGRLQQVARPRHQRGQGQADHVLVQRERGLPRVQRHRRRHHHPLVERLLRPAVAAGRPRPELRPQPRDPDLGGGGSVRLPVADVHRRQQLDDRLQQQQQPGRHPGHQPVGDRPLCAGLRHRQSLAVRRLALRTRPVRQPVVRRRLRRHHRRLGRPGDPALAGQDRDRLVLGERQLHRPHGGGRQHRHPLVERLLRPAVAAGRPRREPQHQPGRAELGDGRGQVLPDPDVRRRHQLDHRLQHHDRHRRQPDRPGHRHRPLRPDERHRPHHPVRLLPVGVPGLRHLTRTPGRPGAHPRTGAAPSP